MSRSSASAAAISGWLQDEEQIPTTRADGAGREIAASWDEGDLDYQTVKDILGDYLTDDEPRPKALADALAGHFGLTLRD
jgi:hypothetical protein